MTTATPTCFADASRITRVSSDRFETTVPDGWQQGRGAFGGLGIGLAIRALESVESEWPLRALTAELPGPLVTGPAEVRVATLRRGSGMVVLEAFVVQGDEVKVRASGTFARSRSTDVAFADPPPSIPSFEAARLVPENALTPPFARFFEYRVTGPAPFAGGSEAEVRGFVRFRVPGPSLGAPELAALADSYWPATFSVFAAPRPMATVTYTLQLTERARSLAPDEPLFYGARAHVASGGFVSERRELYTRAADLVAINLQTFCIIQ